MNIEKNLFFLQKAISENKITLQDFISIHITDSCVFFEIFSRNYSNILHS